MVHRSLKHIEVQLVDDVKGNSILGLSTLCKELRDRTFDSRISQGSEVGRMMAEKAKVKREAVKPMKKKRKLSEETKEKLRVRLA